MAAIAQSIRTGMSIENSSSSGHGTDHLYTANVDVREYDDEPDRNDVMAPARQCGKVDCEIVAEKNGIRGAKQPGCGPVPPAGEESPEISKTGFHPTIEAAFYGHCGCEFGGDERNRNAPEKRNDQRDRSA